MFPRTKSKTIQRSTHALDITINGNINGNRFDNLKLSSLEQLREFVEMKQAMIDEQASKVKPSMSAILTPTF